MQTMSRTAPTAAASIHKPSRARPVTSSCTGISFAFSPAVPPGDLEARLYDVDLGERLFGGFAVLHADDGGVVEIARSAAPCSSWLSTRGRKTSNAPAPATRKGAETKQE